MKDKNKKLYIPVNIRKKKEIVEGIGSKELIKILTAAVAGLLVGGIWFIVKQDMYFFMIPPVVFTMASILFFKKDVTNQSFADRIIFMYEFSKGQKRYYYKYFNVYEAGGLMHERDGSASETDSK